MRVRRGGAAGAPDPHKLYAARPLRHAPGGLVVYLDLFTPYLLRHDHGILDDVLADPYLFLGHKALLHRLLGQRNHHFLPPNSAPEATSPSTSNPINAGLLAAGNLPVLVDEKEFEVVTPRRASRITHHRLAAFISKWGME